MPGWWLWFVLPVLVVIVGGLLLALILFVVSKVRGRREPNTGQAVLVARRLPTSEALLDGAIAMRQNVGELERLHDNRLARLFAFLTIRQTFGHVGEVARAFRQVGVGLSLEPNAPLQQAIDTFGDAEQAYYTALARPLQSPNTLRFLFSKTPRDELDRLRVASDAAMADLKSAARTYLAEVKPPVPPAPRWRLPWPRKRQAQSLTGHA